MITKIQILSFIAVLHVSCAYVDKNSLHVSANYSYDDCQLVFAPKDCVVVVGLITHRYSGEPGSWANVYIRRSNSLIYDSNYTKDAGLNRDNSLNHNRVFTNSSGYATSADSNGIFRVAVPPDQYFFHIQSLGALRMNTKRFDLKGGHRYTFIFNLGTNISY